MCLLDNPKAHYKERAKSQTKQTHAHKQKTKQDNMYHLDSLVTM
jgi:hypothetical protein